MQVRIRDETTLDVEAITALTEAAFLHLPHSAHTAQPTVHALRRTGQLAVSLVAEREGVLIGHVAVSPVTVSDGASGGYGLGPLSVLPQQQGQGTGEALVHAALQALRARGAAGCVPVGAPAYYTRFGFKPLTGLLYPVARTAGL